MLKYTARCEVPTTPQKKTREESCEWTQWPSPSVVVSSCPRGWPVDRDQLTRPANKRRTKKHGRGLAATQMHCLVWVRDNNCFVGRQVVVSLGFIDMRESEEEAHHSPWTPSLAPFCCCGRDSACQRRSWFMGLPFDEGLHALEIMHLDP